MNFVQLDQRSSIATVTLDRPAIHNAFSAEMIAELHEVFAQLATDQTVRVVVLTGAGPSFCAGGDVHWMRSTLDLSREENLADAERLAAMFEAINTLPKPVIGRINGAAIGGGAGLVACCDIAIAADNARFGFSEVKLGIIPGVIARYVIPKIGASHARALFVSGRRFDAAHAQRIGLIHDIASSAALDQVVEHTIDDLLTSGPESIGRAKRLIQASISLRRSDFERYTIDAIADARTSDEGQEGLRAFLDKRKPGWS